jgi:hypothetical protein
LQSFVKYVSLPSYLLAEVKKTSIVAALILRGSNGATTTEVLSFFSLGNRYLCLISSSREEEHYIYDDINPAVAGFGSTEPSVVPEKNLKSEEENKARRK